MPAPTPAAPAPPYVDHLRVEAYPPYPAYPAYPRQRPPRGVRQPPAEEAAPAPAEEDGQDEQEPDPHAVQRYSILEHTTRRLLLEALAGTPWERPLREGRQEDEPDPEEARLRFCAWEDQLRERHQQAIADVWRKVGRFLVGLGTGADGGYGEATWRRLYLTEVAPWADYAEGDEYRYLGLAGPCRR